MIRSGQRKAGITFSEAAYDKLASANRELWADEIMHREMKK